MQQINQAKLSLPAIARHFISNQLIQDKLSQTTFGTITILDAPVGYEKTSQLAYYASTNEQTAWVSLDERDNVLNSFVIYFIKAIQQVNPNFGMKLNKEVSTEENLATLLNEINQLEKPVSIILDSFHTINDASIFSFINSLFAYPQQKLKLIIAGECVKYSNRALSTKGIITQLGDEQLRLTQEDLSNYLKVNRHIPSFINPKEVYAHTQGWPLGVMTLFNLAPNFNRFANVVSEWENHLLNLLDENIASLPNNMRDVVELFVFKVNWFNFDMLQHLIISQKLDTDYTADSLLSTIYNSGVPITKSSKNIYKPLAIVSRINKRRNNRKITEYQKETLIELAEYCNNNDFFDEAFQYFILAGKSELASKIFNRLRTQLMSEGNLNALNQYIKKLPDNNTLAFKLSTIWIKIYTGKFLHIKDEITAIEEALFQEEQKHTDPSIIGEFHLIKAFIYYYLEGDYKQASNSSIKAIDTIDANQDYLFGLGWMYYALSMQALGEAKEAKILLTSAMEEGRKTQSQVLIQTALCLIQWLNGHSLDLLLSAKHIENISSTGILSDNIARSRYFSALAYIFSHNKEKAVLELDYFKNEKLVHTSVFPFWGKVLYLRMLFRELSSEEVNERILELSEWAQQRGEQLLIEYIKLITYYISWFRNKKESAINWAINDTSISVSPLIHVISKQNIRAQILISSEDLNHVKIGLNLIRPIIENPEKYYNIHQRILALITGTIAEYKVGNHQKAIDYFNGAAQLAESNSLYYFFDELKGELIELVNNNLDIIHLNKSLKTIYLSSNDSNLNEEDKKALTKREIEIVLMIHHNFNNNQIADKLFISEKTVKRHIANLYKKLQVNNREEAIKHTKPLLKAYKKRV
ncbi:LuxR C-terminal-related transcriptional regulator [Carboxylicivirga marina]|uniref:LuxR C-terminal-related transcriptional regulator n=1 Tax=Carboxylicivirga marina TaxID=2800988 RepID=UPI00259A64F4|nr:LuxR C-terminal-related transcriptional regulator [uncultured Carboxylicivirga sp.]